MLNRRSFCFGALTLPAFTIPSMASVAPAPTESSLSTEPQVWNKLRRIRFVLNDALDHPFYWWPRTLLSYPIEFQVPADLDRMQLTRVDTGERVPIQFSDVVHVKAGPPSTCSATLNFFSDLPSGAQREFVLTAAASQSVSAAGQTKSRRQHHRSRYRLSVRSPIAASLRRAPGPIMQVSRGGHWIGSSVSTYPAIQSTNRHYHASQWPALRQIRTELQTRAAPGMWPGLTAPAVSISFASRKTLDGLQPGARGMIETTWTGFDPTIADPQSSFSVARTNPRLRRLRVGAHRRTLAHTRRKVRLKPAGLS